MLAKADLQTEVVGEFPELQGVMGRKYALLQGEHPSVAAAIEEHYKPQGPSDRVPTDPVSVAVALADKLDTLVGFWAIDEKPTGSKDPFALRRAALGVIRIVVENGIRLRLGSIIETSQPCVYRRKQIAFRLLTRDTEVFKYPEFWRQIPWPFVTDEDDEIWPLDQFEFARSEDIWVFEKALLPPQGNDELPAELLLQSLKVRGEKVIDKRDELESKSYRLWSAEQVRIDLLSFFHDRLKVYLRDQGARHDLIDAVLASSGGLSPLEGEMSAKPTEGGAPSKAEHGTPPSALPGISPSRGEISSFNDDLLMIVRRVEALGRLIDSEDGTNLLAGTKRAANILDAEEKKGTRIAEAVDPQLLREDAEKRLFAAVNQAEKDAAASDSKRRLFRRHACS